MFVASLYNLKGGVGKTASCVNIAYMAAMDGYKTLLWDLDPQGASSYYYKVYSRGEGNASKLIDQTLSLDDAIMHTDYPNLDIIPADISARKFDEMLGGQENATKHLRALLEDLDAEYDFVFIDCPPGFSHLADNVFYASDSVFMPVIPTTLSVRTYELVKDYFTDRQINLDKLMCFFSMVDIRKNMHNSVMQELFIDKRFFEHYIPYLSEVEKMGLRKAPVETYAPTSYATICYKGLWNEIKEGIME